MKTITITILMICLALSFSCAGKLTPATEVIYEGELIGNESVTYSSALRVVEICTQAKACMGLAETDYPLPKIRGMRGGNAVQCGDNLKMGCYQSGFITVPEGVTVDIIAHECVHHWLNEHTGDPDPMHASPYFLTCGGGLFLEDDIFGRR